MKKFFITIIAIVFTICLYVLTVINYNLFHMVIEILTLIIGVLVLAIYILSPKKKSLDITNSYGAGLFISSFMILLHALTYKGMNVIPGYDANLPTQLWICSNIILSTSVLTLAVLTNRKVKLVKMFSIFTLSGVILTYLCFARIFPDCYIEGIGLTPFKKIMEYIIILIYIASIIILLNKRNKLNKSVLLVNISVIVLLSVAEFMFTLYNDVYAIQNFLGHYLRLIAFSFLLYYIIVDNIKNPYNKLILDLEKSEASLISREKQFRAMFEENNTIMLLIDPNDKKIVLANSAACEFYGWSMEEIQNKYIYEINILPNEQIDNRVESALSNKKNRFYFKHKLASGDIRDVIVDSTLISVNDKKVLYSIIHDNTENVQSERKLSESENKYRSLFSSIRDPLFLVDQKTLKILDVNEAACNVYGYSHEEMLTCIVTDVSAEPGKTVEALNSTSQYIPIRYHKKKNGVAFPVEITMSKIEISGQQYIVSSNRDITDRKNSEDSLKKSEKRLREAQIIGKIGNWELDIETNNIWASEEAFNIYGVDNTFEVLSLEFIQNLVLTEYRDLLDEAMKNLINKNEKYDVEYKMESFKSKKEKYIHSKAELGYDDKGNITRVIGTIQDITESKKIEEKIEATRLILLKHQKLESIGTLASGVAHEINNPINGIMNYGQIILDADTNDINIKEYAQEIINETNRIAEIVKTLLNFSKTDKEDRKYSHIKDIILQTSSFIKMGLKHDQIKLNINIDDDLPKIKCNSQEIQQVIMNLLTNAQDALNERFTHFNENKIINLSCVQLKRDGKKLIKLTIEDFGSGIPESMKDKVFDPFFTTKGRYKGTGLGLSISYGIVKDHQGELTFDSKVNNYTKFTFILPCDNDY